MSPQPDIFVSYSHAHKDLVEPLVQLLRVGGRFIFHDSTSLQPGDNWEEVLRAAVNNANIVVVIWCSHAKESAWCRRESEIAAESQKTLIPVILDATPLPETLSKFQWIVSAPRLHIKTCRFPAHLHPHRRPH